MEDEKLVLIIQQLLALCNQSDFHHQQRKDVLWETISTQIEGKTVDQCQKHYGKKMPWKFEQQMDFIRPCFDMRHHLSNMDDDCSDDMDDGLTVQVNQNAHSSSNASGPSSMITTPTPYPMSSQSIISNPPSSLTRKRKKSQENEQLQAAEVFQSYLQNKPEKQPEDQTAKFFQSIEMTLRSLPYQLQIQTRKKIFDLVTEAEMQACGTGNNTTNYQLNYADQSQNHYNMMPTSSTDSTQPGNPLGQRMAPVPFYTQANQSNQQYQTDTTESPITDWI